MNTDDALPGVHVTPSAARQLPTAGGRLLASTSDTNGQFSLIDATVPPHDSTPVHWASGMGLEAAAHGSGIEFLDG